METDTFAAFEQRQKEEDAREARRRTKAEEAADAAAPEAEEHVHGPECAHGPQTVRRETPKIGRNDPCHCGSGKKFKKCHGA